MYNAEEKLPLSFREFLLLSVLILRWFLVELFFYPEENNPRTGTDRIRISRAPQAPRRDHLFFSTSREAEVACVRHRMAVLHSMYLLTCSSSFRIGRTTQKRAMGNS